MRRLAVVTIAVAGVLALSLLAPPEARAQTPAATPTTVPAGSPTPAPTRRAALAARRAAPVLSIGPETTTAWPRSYLWPSMRSRGR